MDCGDVAGQVPVLGHDGEIARRGRAEPSNSAMLRWVSWRAGQHLRLVGGVAQEAVPEAVPPQPDLGDRLDDRGVLQSDQRLVDRPPGQLAQRFLVELGAERGRQLRDAQVDARCPQAGREDLVDPRRKDLAGVGGDGAAGQLLEEEGDAGSPLDDQSRRCAASRPPSVSAVTSPAASFSLSGSSSMSRTDDAHGASSGEPARDQDHRAGDPLRRQEAQQVDGGGVGPVEVLDQHQRGRRRRRVGEPGDQGLERLLGGARVRPPPGATSVRRCRVPSRGASKGTASRAEAGVCPGACSSSASRSSGGWPG